MQKLIRTGETKYNSRGNKITIVDYRTTRDIDILFDEYDWTCKNARYDLFKKGNIRCPYERTIYGIGYIGEGKYHSTENKEVTHRYRVWQDMIRRCYSEKSKEKRPTYVDCSVNEEWHNFQNFAEWYNENYYEIRNEMMCLDKDILIKGNKVYNSDTCVFVPERINKMFIKSDKTRGEYPIGVCYHKGKHKYIAHCNNYHHTGSIELGAFENPLDAFYTYKQYKELTIKRVADDYKEMIPKKLYEAMYNYIVEITD